MSENFFFHFWRVVRHIAPQTFTGGDGGGMLVFSSQALRTTSPDAMFASVTFRVIWGVLVFKVGNPDRNLSLLFIVTLVVFSLITATVLLDGITSSNPRTISIDNIKKTIFWCLLLLLASSMSLTARLFLYSVDGLVRGTLIIIDYNQLWASWRKEARHFYYLPSVNVNDEDDADKKCWHALKSLYLKLIWGRGGVIEVFLYVAVQLLSGRKVKKRWESNPGVSTDLPKPFLTLINDGGITENHDSTNLAQFIWFSYMQERGQYYVGCAYNGKTIQICTHACRTTLFAETWPSASISSNWTTVHRTTAHASTILQGPHALGTVSTGNSCTVGNPPQKWSTYWQSINILRCNCLEWVSFLEVIYGWQQNLRKKDSWELQGTG